MKTHRIAPPRRALTLVEVLVIVAAIAVLAALVLPPLYRAKAHSSGINCRNNLKQLWMSFEIWAIDHTGEYPMLVSATNGGTMEWVVSGAAWPHLRALSNELNTPKGLLCPDDKGRVAATNWNDLRNGNVSYFVGVEASSNRPAMLLAGDRQVTREGKDLQPGLHLLDARQELGWSKQIHKNAGTPLRGRKGHVALVDGNVQQVDAVGLRELLAKSGTATNLLAIP